MSPAPAALPDAVLWDMDGTLVDTEPYWIEAETDLVASHGGTWTHEDGLALVGNPLLVSGEILVRRSGIDLTPGAGGRRAAGPDGRQGGRAGAVPPGRPRAAAVVRRRRASPPRW